MKEIIIYKVSTGLNSILTLFGPGAIKFSHYCHTKPGTSLTHPSPSGHWPEKMAKRVWTSSLTEVSRKCVRSEETSAPRRRPLRGDVRSEETSAPRRRPLRGDVRSEETSAPKRRPLRRDVRSEETSDPKRHPSEQ